MKIHLFQNYQAKKATHTIQNESSTIYFLLLTVAPPWPQILSIIHGYSTLAATNKSQIIRSKEIISIDSCIHRKTNPSSIPTKTPPMTTRPVSHARDMLPGQKRTGRRNSQVCSPRDFSRCCCCCCLSWSACGHADRLVAIRTKPHRFRYCCRRPTITPRPFTATANFPVVECTRPLRCATLPYQTNPR